LAKGPLRVLRSATDFVVGVTSRLHSLTRIGQFSMSEIARLRRPPCQSNHIGESYLKMQKAQTKAGWFGPILSRLSSPICPPPGMWADNALYPSGSRLWSGVSGARCRGSRSKLGGISESVAFSHGCHFLTQRTRVLRFLDSGPRSAQSSARGHPVVKTPKFDWWLIGSLALTVASLAGLVYLFWSSYRAAR
jgi:hypothetical protein